jgi:hypothetical protein
VCFLSAGRGITPKIFFLSIQRREHLYGQNLNRLRVLDLQ